jgi:large subunit ribosomal protein L10
MSGGAGVRPLVKPGFPAAFLCGVGKGLKSRRREVERAQKREVVSELNEVFNSTSSVVVTHYSGLNVAELSDLRGRMREAGATFKVTKNRLTKLALDGTPYDHIADLFTGPTAIAYSDDPVAPAKIAVEFAKKNDLLVVLGGAMGDTQLDVDGVKALAALPSLDELRGKIVGLLNAPATKVARVLQAPAGQLARVMSAQGAKDEAA